MSDIDKDKDEFDESDLASVLVVDDHEHAFLDEAAEEAEELEADAEVVDAEEVTGTELEGFESAEIEEREELEDERILSIVESVLFATDRPISVAAIKQAFKGTQVRSAHIRRALDQLMIQYADGQRGVCLEEVASGYQIRTKADNLNYLRQMAKSRPFKLSGPALEVLAIVAYKQPVVKSELDQIRGVESGHLLRALMEKGLVSFAGKSDLPGKPMLYQTTRKFLEIFGLRNIKELPSLGEIDQLIPEGIGDIEEKEQLSDLTGQLSREAGAVYSEGEVELSEIAEEISNISTSSEFFEKEKQRQKEQRDRERAQDIREALTVGEAVEDKDRRWLERYEADQLAAEQAKADIAFVTGESEVNLQVTGASTDSAMSSSDFSSDESVDQKNEPLAEV